MLSESDLFISFSNLKPGGWVEFQSVTGVLSSDDNSLRKDGAFQAFADNLGAACAKFGAPIDDPFRWKGQLEAQGFEEVTEKVYKLPCNTWPKDERLKFLGAWEMHNLLTNLEGFCSRLYQKGLGWTDEEVQVFLPEVRKDIRDRSNHVYWP